MGIHVTGPYLFFNLSNIAVCILANLLIFILYKKLRTHEYIPPEPLGQFWKTCYYPFVLIGLIGSGLFSIYSLFDPDPQSYVYKTSRIILKFAMQQIRMAIFMTLLERIIATKMLEKYSNFAQSFALLSILTVSSFACTTIYTFSGAISIFFLGSEPAFQITAYSIFGMHVFIIIICRLLYIKNNKMYKMLAFRISLKQRHQILQNIKLLSQFWTGILIISLIAPLGSVVSLTYYFIMEKEAPISCFYLFYNLSFGILAGVYLIEKQKEDAKVQDFNGTDGNIIVLSPLGKNLPTNISVDKYFNDLKMQWK